ncbi:hypothetical protein ABZP36_007556 [Zizania latifolia]
MEEDLVIDDEDSWDLLVRDLRLKATFLYIDLSRVISFCEIDEHKKMLTGLANKFFIFMDEVSIASPVLASLSLKLKTGKVGSPGSSVTGDSCETMGLKLLLRRSSLCSRVQARCVRLWGQWG